MQTLLFVSLAFFASVLLGFCESGKNEDVFVSKEMLQEFQNRVFDKINQIGNEVREVKEKVAGITEKVLLQHEFYFIQNDFSHFSTILFQHNFVSAQFCFST